MSAGYWILDLEGKRMKPMDSKRALKTRIQKIVPSSDGRAEKFLRQVREIAYGVYLFSTRVDHSVCGQPRYISHAISISLTLGIFNSFIAW